MVVLMKKTILVTLFCSALLLLTAGCNRNALTGSKLTLANYQQVNPGMTKAQVERIMGSPTTFETKDMLVFKKTTYRYEDGSKFALFTFKNDELDSKDTNLAAP
jgi:outer membrane protein assembly factor BamE (lipoprotein component of BamABCDE complex)